MGHGLRERKNGKNMLMLVVVKDTSNTTYWLVMNSLAEVYYEQSDNY